MATLNVQNLLVEINKKIVQTTDNEELLMLSKAVSVLKTGAIFTVGTFANLPDASENVGRLYFVENDGILYFSYVDYANVEYWIPITNVSANTLWTWGANFAGKLGDGTTVGRSSPGTTWGSFTTWCQVSSALLTVSSHAAAIKTDGTLWTWGNNTCGSLGDGTILTRCSPGTIFGGGTWCQVFSGNSIVAAIKTDGTLWTWGSNSFGVLGNGTTLDRSSPGTVAGGGTNWCQVSGGGTFIASIKTDGTLWSWGCNNCGQLGDGTVTPRSSPGTVAGGGTTWSKVTSNCLHTVALKSDGTLWTWGRNLCGILGDGTTVSRCSPGTTWGSFTDWCDVSASNCHSSAIKTDGTLWTWGCNAQGRLGNGTTTDRCSPGTVAGGGTNWCQVSGGCNISPVIKTDGTLWTWGFNQCGVLGDGTTIDRCSPGTVAGGGTLWNRISAGGNFIMGIVKETL